MAEEDDKKRKDHETGSFEPDVGCDALLRDAYRGSVEDEQKAKTMVALVDG